MNYWSLPLLTWLISVIFRARSFIFCTIIHFDKAHLYTSTFCKLLLHLNILLDIVDYSKISHAFFYLKKFQFVLLFFRRPMRSNEPTNNQHFFHLLISSSQIKSIAKPNHRDGRFRETLVELSIETNSIDNSTKRQRKGVVS